MLCCAVLCSDVRAQAPVEPPKPVKPTEPRVIIEADVVEPVLPVPPQTVEVVDSISSTAPIIPSVRSVSGGGAIVPPIAPAGGSGMNIPSVAPSVPRPLLKGTANPGACLANWNGAAAAAKAAYAFTLFYPLQLLLYTTSGAALLFAHCSLLCCAVLCCVVLWLYCAVLCCGCAECSTYQATYKSRGVRYSQPRREFGINAKYADCSSFVTSILNDVGMNCLFAAGR